MRISLTLLLAHILLFAFVSTLPVLPTIPEIEAAEPIIGPVVNAYNEGLHWLVRSDSLPVIRDTLSSPSTSRFERILSLGRSRAKVEFTAEGNIKMINDGPRPLLFKFGTRDRIYVLQPRTREVLARSELTEQQYKALTIHKLPLDATIVYGDAIM